MDIDDEINNLNKNKPYYEQNIIIPYNKIR
jgi:hypothetical protein